MSDTKSFYEESIEKLKSSLKFSYSIMDELFTFVGNKQNRYYVWTAMAYTQTNKPFYYYYYRNLLVFMSAESLPPAFGNARCTRILYSGNDRTLANRDDLFISHLCCHS